MRFTHLGLDGMLLKKRHAAMTEQLVVPHVLLCHIQTWHHFLSCQFVSFAVKSGISFSSFSCQSFTLTGTICYMQSLSVALSAGNFRFVLKFTYLLQSGVFISSSFSWQAFMLTGSHLPLAGWAERLVSLSLSSASSTFPAFARLSLPASLVSSSYRQCGSAVKQDLCCLLYSACLHNC